MNWLFEVFLFLAIPSCLLYCIIRLLFIRKYKIFIYKELIRLVTITYLIYLVYIVWLIPTATLDYLPFNFIPFKTIIDYFISLINGTLTISTIIKNIFGNILLTIPLGMLIPLNIKNLALKKLVEISIITPFIIESVQYFLHLSNFGTRSIDIDDLILNFLGVIIGYKMYNYLFIRFNKSFKKNSRTKSV